MFALRVSKIVVFLCVCMVVRILRLSCPLVDALGGLRSALDLAKVEIGVDPETEVVLVPYPAPSSLFDTVIGTLSTRSQNRVAEWLIPLSARSLWSFQSFLQKTVGQPLALMPVLVP